MWANVVGVGECYKLVGGGDFPKDGSEDAVLEVADIFKSYVDSQSEVKREV